MQLSPARMSSPRQEDALSGLTVSGWASRVEGTSARHVGVRALRATTSEMCSKTVQDERYYQGSKFMTLGGFPDAVLM